MSTNATAPTSKKRQKPIMLATHPRACSTAFERVFMSRLHCIHEPFGDAFYFGPERLSERYENDEVARKDSGFADVTFEDVVASIMKEEKGGAEGKRLFIKDIAHYLIPPSGKPASIAPSLTPLKDGVTSNGETRGSPEPNTPPYPYPTASEPSNPTVLPLDILRRFHWTFLIRHPRFSIPSYYRCTIPPLSHQTGFHHFLPSEAGYAELRRLFEYLRAEGVIGPQIAGREDGSPATANDDDDDDDTVEICLIDADALLSSPPATIQAFCRSTRTPYDPTMLSWAEPDSRSRAQRAFAKWRGFHEEAIRSTGFFPPPAPAPVRAGAGERNNDDDEEEKGWREMFGEEGAKVVKEVVEACLEDYEFLRKFAVGA